MAVPGLRFCARALPSCGKRGPPFTAVRRPLTITASPAVEHRLQTRRLSNRGSRAQPLRGTRDHPRPGLEPVCPALAGRLPTTAPPGKPPFAFLKAHFKKIYKIKTLHNCIILCYVTLLYYVILHCLFQPTICSEPHA